MLTTFKNIRQANGRQFMITDFDAFILTNGIEGTCEVTPENLNKYEYITIEVNEINNKYRQKYNAVLKPILESINLNVNNFLTRHPDFLENKNNYYTKFAIPKKKPDANGKTRWRHLINPDDDLKHLQRFIADKLTEAGLLAHNAAHAFRPARDYYTNATIHKNSVHMICMDLKDFFDTISENMIRNQLKEHPLFNVDNVGDETIENIIKIATLDGTTPQGSPLSPFLSNIIMTRFDYEIRKALNHNPIATFYTRYADDTTFSSKKSNDIKEIIRLVENVIHTYYNDELKINYEKTKKLKRGRCFITGVKINKENNITIGWEKKKLIKTRIHNLANIIRQGVFDIDYSETDAKAEAYSVMGYLSFMSRAEKEWVDALKTTSNYSEDIRLIENYLKADDLPF